MTTTDATRPARISVFGPRTPFPAQPTTRPPMTPLDTTRTVHLPSMTTGRPTRWIEFSVDGLWEYEHTDHTGTPWRITHTPSGITYNAMLPTLDAARSWTYADGAVDTLRLQALADVSGVNNPEPRTLRGLRLLLGVIVDIPGIAAESVCECGGFLVDVKLADGSFSNRWVHLDRCPECETEPARCGDANRNPDHGPMCDRPRPVQCEHGTCHTACLLPNECEVGHDHCCGCCRGHHDDD